MVATRVADAVAREPRQAPTSYRKRQAESSRFTYYVELVGGFVREEPSINGSLHHRETHGCDCQGSRPLLGAGSRSLGRYGRAGAESNLRQSAETRGYVCHGQVV